MDVQPSFTMVSCDPPRLQHCQWSSKNSLFTISCCNAWTDKKNVFESTCLIFIIKCLDVSSDMSLHLFILWRCVFINNIQDGWMDISVMGYKALISYWVMCFSCTSYLSGCTWTDVHLKGPWQCFNSVSCWFNWKSWMPKEMGMAANKETGYI